MLRFFKGKHKEKINWTSHKGGTMGEGRGGGGLKTLIDIGVWIDFGITCIINQNSIHQGLTPYCGTLLIGPLELCWPTSQPLVVQ